jgi:nitrate reductase NapAB chaperone NapD
MPTCSYIIHPAPGLCDRLTGTLNRMHGCSAIRADRHEVIILVTETRSDIEERALQTRLKEQQDIHAMALTFGDVSPALREEAAR